MLRAGIILSFIILLIGCSLKGSKEAIENSGDIEIADAEKTLQPEDFTIVNGALFKVSDFVKWQNAYKKISQNLIVCLRNVDDLSMVVVFEGNVDRESAEMRSLLMTSDDFINEAGVEGAPATTYYTIDYFNTPEENLINYLGLSFVSDQFSSAGEFLQSRADVLSEKGLKAIGIGANPDSRDQVYMLFTLTDAKKFREEHHSTGSLKTLLNTLDLPENAVISFWVATAH